MPTPLPEANDTVMTLGRNLDGCRIGFDLGGSDRKCAALIDGEVVFSEEIVWDPYFQSDPNYHIEGIHDSLKRAAAHLPRVDAIGGSSAGVYVNNEVRAASLFRGVSEADFENHIRRIFFTLKERWNGIPFEVVNDGEVTALAGSMGLNANRVLGVAMGTSQAAGYVDAEGHIKPWLNELAFAPVDFRDPADSPVDEWSGDHGCGALYFSQQAVARLAPAAGFDFGMPFPEQFVKVQEAMKAGDPAPRRSMKPSAAISATAIAHYADYYDIANLLILGRVTSGEGGTMIINEAETVLAKEFPDLRIKLVVPDEKTKRHGQAVAAASLPPLTPRSVSIGTPSRPSIGPSRKSKALAVAAAAIRWRITARRCIDAGRHRPHSSAMSSANTNSPGKQLVFHQTGKPCEVLELAPFTPQPPQTGEVLLRMLAAPINPADLNTIEGTYGVKLELPATPGVEGCGEIVTSGDAGFQTGRSA
jgi:predicted NBD/HSP70 family sugar kinase